MTGEPSLASLDKKLAVICERTDHIMKGMERSSKAMDDYITRTDTRLSKLELCETQSQTELDDIEKEVGTLRIKTDELAKRSNTWDGINTILTILAGILGLTKS